MAGNLHPQALLEALASSGIPAPADLCRAAWHTMGATPETAAVLCQHPTLPPDIHEAIGTMVDVASRRAWVQHPQTTVGQLRDVVATDTRVKVRVAVAGAPNIDRPLIETLLTYRKAAIWRALAENPAANTIDTSRALAKIAAASGIHQSHPSVGVMLTSREGCQAFLDQLPPPTRFWSANTCQVVQQAAELVDSPEAWRIAYAALVAPEVTSLEETLKEAETSPTPHQHYNKVRLFADGVPLRECGRWMMAHPASAAVCAETVEQVDALLTRANNLGEPTRAAHQVLDALRACLRLLHEGLWPAPDDAPEEALLAVADQMIAANLHTDLPNLYEHPAVTMAVIEKLTAADVSGTIDELGHLVEAHATNGAAMVTLLHACHDTQLSEMRTLWEESVGPNHDAVLREMFESGRLHDLDPIIDAGFRPPQEWWPKHSAVKSLSYLEENPTQPAAVQVATALLDTMGDANEDRWSALLTLMAETLPADTTLAELVAVTEELTSKPAT